MELPSKQLTIGVSNTATPRSDKQEPELSKQELTRVQSTKKYLELNHDMDAEQDTALLTRKRKNQAERAATSPEKKAKRDDMEVKLEARDAIKEVWKLIQGKHKQARSAIILNKIKTLSSLCADYFIYGLRLLWKRRFAKALAEELTALDEFIEVNPNFMAETFDKFIEEEIENDILKTATQLTDVKQVNESKSLSDADLKPTDKGTDDKSVTVTAVTAMDIMKATEQVVAKPTLQDVKKWGAHSSYAMLFTLAELQYPAFMKSEEGQEYLNKLHEEAKSQAGEQTVSGIFSALQAQGSVIKQAKQVKEKPAEQEPEVPELCKNLLPPDEYEKKNTAMDGPLRQLNQERRARNANLKRLKRTAPFRNASDEERRKMFLEVGGPEPNNPELDKMMEELRTHTNNINKVCRKQQPQYPSVFGKKSQYNQKSRLQCVDASSYRSRWNVLAELSTKEGKEKYKKQEEKRNALIAERLKQQNVSFTERLKQRTDGIGYLARNTGHRIEVITL